MLRLTAPRLLPARLASCIAPKTSPARSPSRAQGPNYPMHMSPQSKKRSLPLDTRAAGPTAVPGSEAPLAAAPGAPAPKMVVAAEVTVPALAAPLRVDEALLQLLPREFPSLSRSKRSLRRGEVLVEGQRARTDTELRGGERLQWLQRTAGHSKEMLLRDKTAGALPRIQVVFEDDHLAAVVKPQGMPMEKSLVERVTLQQCLPHALAPSAAVGAMRRPHYAHRLDEATGGLVLAGKSSSAMRALGEAFESRRITKRYRALAWGRLEGRGLVKFTLDGKPSETEYHAISHSPVLWASGSGTAGAAAEGSGGQAAAKGGGGAAGAGREAGGAPEGQRGGSCAGGSGGPGRAEEWVTTLDLFPHTGRTHQLRRHLALIGHPLVGDGKYTRGYAKQRLESGLDLPPEAHVRLPPAREGGSAGAGQRQDPQQPQQQGQQQQAQQGALGFEPPAQGEAVGAAAAAGGGQPAPISRVVRAESQLAVCQAAGAAGEEAAAECSDMGSSDGQDAGAPPPATGAVDAWSGYLAPVLCLWAVQLDLRHPVSGAPLHFELQEPELFEAIRAELATPRN